MLRPSITAFSEFGSFEQLWHLKISFEQAALASASASLREARLACKPFSAPANQYKSYAFVLRTRHGSEYLRFAEVFAGCSCPN